MIIFVKVKQIGNKYILLDDEGNRIFKEFFDSEEEAQKHAQQIRYACIDGEEDDEDEYKFEGMFWEWYADLIELTSESSLIRMYLHDKIYNPNKEPLKEYISYIRQFF